MILGCHKFVILLALGKHLVAAYVLEVAIKTTFFNNLAVHWHAFKESADKFVRRTQLAYGNGEESVTLLLDTSNHVEVSGGIVRYQSPNPNFPGKRIPWEDMAAYLHMAFAQVFPSQTTFELEMRESDWAGSDPDSKRNVTSSEIGLFVLQSPNRNLWPVLADSLRDAWQKGLISSVRAHVLVHHIADWKRLAWEEILGAQVARRLLRGFHWCFGVQRTPRPPGSWGWDSYYQKMHTIIAIMDHVGYKYMASFDDDVALPSSHLAAILNSGPRADALQCGVVSPLLQNGVPSVELFANSFFSDDQIDRLYTCFAGSSADFAGASYQELEPLPSPWDSTKWYDRLALIENDFKGLHPVRGNDTCMSIALDLALEVLPREWQISQSSAQHNLYVDRDRAYPYFCNNAYLMLAANYRDAVLRPEYARKTDADEIPINLLLKAQGLAMCFVDRSFGIHPAYNHNPYRHQLERAVLHALLPYVSPAAARAIRDEVAKGEIIQIIGGHGLVRQETR